MSGTIFITDAFFYDPLDLDKTSVILFFTRWITHFCAPIFVMLAGTSAFLSGQRKTKKELAAFLLKRGIWLIILELTVINFSWFFNTHFTFFHIRSDMGTGTLHDFPGRTHFSAPEMDTGHWTPDGFWT